MSNKHDDGRDTLVSLSMDLVAIRTRDDASTEALTTQQLASFLKKKLQNISDDHIAYVIGRVVFVYNLNRGKVEHVLTLRNRIVNVTFLSDHELVIATEDEKSTYDMNLFRYTHCLWHSFSAMQTTPHYVITVGRHVVFSYWDFPYKVAMSWNTDTNEEDYLTHNGARDDVLIGLLKVDNNHFCCQFDSYITVCSVTPLQHIKRILFLPSDPYFTLSLWDNKSVLITEDRKIVITGVFDSKTHVDKEIQGIGHIDWVHKVDNDNIVIVHEDRSKLSEICTLNIKNNERQDFVVKQMPGLRYYFEGDLFVCMESNDMIVHSIRTQTLVQRISGLDKLEMFTIKPKF